MIGPCSCLFKESIRDFAVYSMFRSPRSSLPLPSILLTELIKLSLCINSFWHS